jgi:pimeloyl-ACP methyl ester carboxylesterase
MKGSMIAVNGLNLYCRDTATARPAMLCLHGKWGTGETWADFVSRYERRYRLIVPDQRGHGLSDKPVVRYAPEDFAEDAHQVIEKLGCGPVIAVGHSMGARSAGFLAAMYPGDVKACCILDINADGPARLSEVPPDQVGTEDDLSGKWRLPYATIEDAEAHFRELFRFESNVRYFAESLVKTGKGYEFMFSQQAMAAVGVYKHEWYDKLEQIRCPVLLVRATESTDLSPVQAVRMRERIRDCTYYEVSNSDHMVHADNPEGFYPPFDRFLAGLDDTKA